MQASRSGTVACSACFAAQCQVVLNPNIARGLPALTAMRAVLSRESGHVHQQVQHRNLRCARALSMLAISVRAWGQVLRHRMAIAQAVVGWPELRLMVLLDHSTAADNGYCHGAKFCPRLHRLDSCFVTAVLRAGWNCQPWSQANVGGKALHAQLCAMRCTDALQAAATQWLIQ